MSSAPTTLYEEARQVGLAAEKFMLDGRHVGTGGGNHVVMGGATPEPTAPSCAAGPAEVAGRLLAQPPEPFLPVQRPVHRPDQPASARGRGAMDAIYELEIAFAQVKPLAADAALADRPHLPQHPADMTGNTHRTEFCIDKMYDPGRGGRRGLVEFRGFEMPPHARDVGRADAADARRRRRLLGTAL
jgi:uncharacterized protein (DUF2126 family)